MYFILTGVNRRLAGFPATRSSLGARRASLSWHCCRMLAAQVCPVDAFLLNSAEFPGPVARPAPWLDWHHGVRQPACAGRMSDVLVCCAPKTQAKSLSLRSDGIDAGDF